MRSQFSKWEDYGCRFLTRGVNIETADHRNWIRVNADYVKFRLFALSILWRMGITTLEEFESVRLGIHSEILRSALYQETPPAVTEYPIMVQIITFANRFYPDMFISPSQAGGDNSIIHLVILGYHFSFFLDKKLLTDAFLYTVINKAGDFWIPILPTTLIPKLHEGILQIGEISRGKRERIVWPPKG